MDELELDLGLPSTVGNEVVLLDPSYRGDLLDRTQRLRARDLDVGARMRVQRGRHYFFFQCGGMVFSKYGNCSTRFIHAAIFGGMVERTSRSGFLRSMRKASPSQGLYTRAFPGF